MKKLFSFVAMALLSATTFAATQYCQEPLEATDGMALLSMKHVSGNTYAVELVAQGGMKFTAAYNINCGVNQTDGAAGIGFAKEKFVISADGLTATCEFETGSAESVPTTLWGNYMCFGKQGGTTARDLVEFNLGAITDIDWTATCAAGPEDTEAPVMGEATFASATYTSITLNVSATDNVAVKRYHVVTTGVDKDILPANNQIVITGLTAGNTYTIEVTAKDAAGNESANKATVSDVQTLSYPAAPAAPVHAQDKVRSIYSDTYTSALAHDFAKNMWNGIQYEEITLDENNHYLFYTTTNVNWIAWGENNDEANAIIAAEGYNDGTHQGLDLSVLDYLHVDIFVDANCVSGEVFINDDRLAGLGTLEGGKWNSLNLSLEDLKSGLTEEKQESKINSTRWIKFVGLNGVSMVIIDNVYAWKNGTSTAVDANEVATKVSKMIENGQVVIIREGVKYDVTGRAIER